MRLCFTLISIKSNINCFFLLCYVATFCFIPEAMLPIFSDGVWPKKKEKRKEKEIFLLVKPMLMFQQGIRGPKKLLAELQGERKRKEEKKTC